MKAKTEPLTEQQMQTINGGDGIVAYDPVTGKPFEEETGGYPHHSSNEQSGTTPFPQDRTMGEG